MVVGMKLSATPVATSSRPGRTATTYPDSVGAYASHRWPAARTTRPMTRLRRGPRARSTRGRTPSETTNPVATWGPSPAPPAGGPWRGPAGGREPPARTWTLGRRRRARRGRPRPRVSGTGTARAGRAGRRSDARRSRRPPSALQRRQGSRRRAGRPSQVCREHGAVHQNDDRCGDGCGTAPVEPASGSACALWKYASGQDDSGHARPGRSRGTPTASPGSRRAVRRAATPVAPPSVEAAPQVLIALARCLTGEGQQEQ